MNDLLVLEDSYADDAFVTLATLEIHLDVDPVSYGPKRLNAKVAEARKMLSKCERIYLDVSSRHARFRRAHLRMQAILDIGKKDLLANDPEVRAGRNVADRDAIASVKLKSEVEEASRLDRSAQELEVLLTVIRAKRSDLRDSQGRLRDQIRLCQEELGLGGRWGSKSPRGIELEPGQGIATGGDVEDIENVIAVVASAMDAERHLPAEPDLSEDPDALDALLESADMPESEEAEDSESPVPFEKFVAGFLNSVSVPETSSVVTEQVLEETDDEMETRGTEEPVASDVLPSRSDTADVDVFLNTLEMPPKKKRRQVEEETALDIDALLKNFGG